MRCWSRPQVYGFVFHTSICIPSNTEHLLILQKHYSEVQKHAHAVLKPRMKTCKAHSISPKAQVPFANQSQLYGIARDRIIAFVLPLIRLRDIGRLIRIRRLHWNTIITISESDDEPSALGYRHHHIDLPWCPAVSWCCCCCLGLGKREN